jgi:signal transduction histidine kinase
VKGVGLGLSVCYGIIKDHSGEIKVESKEDKGTTFTISLPIESLNQDVEK